MSNLGDVQREFARLVPRLIDKAHEMGFAVTLGDAHRSPQEAKRLGFEQSNHTRCLAIDLNLFALEGGEWVYLTDTDDHRPLGEWWEQQHPRARWGGAFGDGNHYSFEWKGII